MKKNVNVTFYEEGTPEYVLACFFDCWQKHDFDKMINHCQKYWVESTANPIEGVEDRFGNFELEEVLYIQ